MNIAPQPNTDPAIAPSPTRTKRTMRINSIASAVGRRRGHVSMSAALNASFKIPMAPIARLTLLARAVRLDPVNLLCVYRRMWSMASDDDSPISCSSAGSRPSSGKPGTTLFASPRARLQKTQRCSKERWAGPDLFNTLAKCSVRRRSFSCLSAKSKVLSMTLRTVRMTVPSTSRASAIATKFACPCSVPKKSKSSAPPTASLASCSAVHICQFKDRWRTKLVP
mmetsp:Transcript_71569/g.126944  ORF Transcript_71569/g.126944 Transcript_71569/m.126944 type:complete len:224 (+) Transcript_71569:1501-2172(+)